MVYCLMTPLTRTFRKNHACFSLCHPALAYFTSMNLVVRERTKITKTEKKVNIQRF